MPGKEIMAYNELIDNLAYINSSRDNYLSDFKDKIDNIISKYYSVKKGGCSEEYYDFIKNNNWYGENNEKCLCGHECWPVTSRAY